MTGARRPARTLLELVYPTRAVCLGCGAQSGLDRPWVCPDCRAAMARDWVGAFPPPAGGGMRGAAAAYPYRGPAGSLVRRLKYGGARRLAGWMASDMVRALRALEPTGADCVVPVPMHPRRLRRRGFNHAALLAARVAERLELPLEDALLRVRHTRQQARLSDEARRKNLRDAIAPRLDVAGRRIVLVDDVCTTGATACACAKALLDGGAASVFLLCYATALRKD